MMTDLKQLIDSIDLEIDEIEKDTNRGLKGLWKLLIKLAKEKWEAKSNFKKWETSYKIGIINKKWEKELELSKKEWVKITDAELNRYAEKELADDLKSYKENDAISDYIEPILNAYDNYVNDYKFDAKDLTRVEKF